MTGELTQNDMRCLTRKDVQRIVSLAMASPVDYGECKEFDGKTPFKEIASSNITVGSRIIAKMVKMASDGDVKAADFVFKYGGYTPVTEAQVEFTMPTFIDDMSNEKDITNQVEVSEPKPIEAPKIKKEDKITDTVDVKVVDITQWGT